MNNPSEAGAGRTLEGMDQPANPRRDSQVAEQMNNMGMIIRDLISVQDALEAQLSQVLRAEPSSTQPSVNEQEKAVQELVPLASYLRDCVGELNSLRDRVNHILDTLEL